MATNPGQLIATADCSVARYWSLIWSEWHANTSVWTTRHMSWTRDAAKSCSTRCRNAAETTAGNC